MDDWLRRIESHHPSEIELGLDRVRLVYDRLGLAQRLPFSFVVAGTNGKGSTVRAIDAGLRSVGLNVGCYTSPHISRFNERVTINGTQATDEQLIDAFERVDSARAEISLTYFEFTTLAALLVFSADELNQLDAIVCEVGLGGRLDAVNVIDSDIAVVTSIGMDHQEWLGNTLEQIAREKAGILRLGKPALIGESFPLPVLNELIRAGYSVARFGHDFGQLSESNDSQRLFHYGSELCAVDCIAENPLPTNNLCLAMQACLTGIWEIKGYDSLSVDMPQIGRVISQVSVPGRVERVRDFPPIILDVAHNPEAAQFLSGYVESRFPVVKPVAVFSCLKDKDVRAIVASTKECFYQWFVAELDHPRAMPVEEIISTIQSFGLQVSAFDDLERAFDKANVLALVDSRPLFIFGSFFVLEKLGEKARPHE